MTTALKNKGKTVFVGLSGGGFGVSAALLLREGYKVVGLFARISLAGYRCTAGGSERRAAGGDISTPTSSTSPTETA